jgi:hypothetical protein
MITGRIRVQVERSLLDASFSGRITVRNRHDFLSLVGCHFEWKLLRFPKASDPGGEEEMVEHGKQEAPGGRKWLASTGVTRWLA